MCFKILNDPQSFFNFYNVRNFTQINVFIHLLYANDILQFCNANEKETSNLIQILGKYNSIADQSPNLSKYDIFFSNNAFRDLQIRLIVIMEIQESNNNITFLGNPLFIHKNKTNQFNKILEILAQKSVFISCRKFLISCRKCYFNSLNLTIYSHVHYECF